MKAAFNRLFEFLNIETELENYDVIHGEILKGVKFKGTNLWILFFAIIVASVGLNINSTAVIIGAMLISPLMGPINGMGYSIATYNFELFRQALKNFMFAVLVSLLASTAYFAISPISTAHSELLARTGPTIYDVLIALFGGLAGIVAISSKLKGNVIPGVAIATALMPPLCTAGYGLATAQFDFFFGALYLFTINTVFIGIASMIVSQYLNFPIRTIINVAHRKKVNRIITLVIFIVLIPSIYFGYLLVQKERFSENAGQYINNVSNFEGNYLLKSTIDADTHTITLFFGGKNFTPEQKEIIIHKADNFKLDRAQIVIKQGVSPEGQLDENSELIKLKEELNKVTILLNEKDDQIDSLKAAYSIGNTLFQEIKTLYPEIESCMYAESIDSNDTTQNAEKIAIVLFRITKKISKSDREKIELWVKERLKRQKVKIIYE